ncbi:hypothetical protein MASR2M18_12700 [Ignavibacteria bacterium]|nr:hypothetical protein [Bacteroidota bacterium]
MNRIKYFLASLLIVLGGIFATFSNSLAQCPPGWIGGSVSATYEYTSPGSPSVSFVCKVTIKYCCRYIYAQNKREVMITQFYGTPFLGIWTNNCPSAIPDWNDFITWLHMVAGDAASATCPATSIPPCSEGIKIIEEVTSSRCWKVENNKYDAAYHDYYWRHDWIACSSEAKCITTYEVCMDYTTSPATISRKFISRQAIGTTSCSSEIPDFPDEEEEHWETECFARNCQ